MTSKTNTIITFLYIAVSTVIGLVVNSSATGDEVRFNVKLSDFPPGFYFGAGTSAAQTEGSANEGGRGPSWWDYRIRILPDTVQNSANFSEAVQGYKRYREDIKLVKNLGANAYRFSISWSRILPKGSISDGVNQEGIDHYNSLINDLIENGITPFVTLYHYDLPQALQDKYGGLLSPSFLNDFKDYAELCFKSFGDRVRHWFTLNEPTFIASFGYERGIIPPGRCSLPKGFCVFPAPTPGKCNVPAGPCDFGGNSSTEPYIVGHNLILAHASVVKFYRETYQAQQKGEIGISLNGVFFLPYSQSEQDKAAVKRLFDFSLGWFMEPFLYGAYPKSMRKLVKERLPRFSTEEKSLVKGSLGDFLGMNYYQSAYAKDSPPPANETLRYSIDSWAKQIDIRDGDLGGVSNSEWPEGLQKLLQYVKKKYLNPKIIISENGTPETRNDTLPLSVQLNDSHRISYIRGHLYRLHNAIRNGVNITGYIHWALLDTFEWSSGYSKRYGLHHVDYTRNYMRIPKSSAKWFQKFLQGKISTIP